jgi:hypothetical protein
MSRLILEFTAAGSPDGLSRAIEEQARLQRMLSVLVVPWESSEGSLSMAVTAVKGDGWAIEHTNLGTIRLAALEGGGTRIAVSAEESEAADAAKREQVLSAFARQLQERLHVGEPAR